MLLNSFVGAIYQGLRKVCATSGPCISTRTWFVLNGSPCLIELTRCGRKPNQPSSIAWRPLCQPTRCSQCLDGMHERQQLPLKLAWAITIHKSQGLTLPKAWIDIGQTEKTAGILYVAISRVKTLCSCIIEPMTFERLKGLRNSTNLKYRLEEEKRLDELAQDTCRNLIKK